MWWVAGRDKTWEALREIRGGFTNMPKGISVQREPNGQLRPTDAYPIIRADPAGGYEVIDARWWVVPYYQPVARRAGDHSHERGRPHEGRISGVLCLDQIERAFEADDITVLGYIMAAQLDAVQVDTSREEPALVAAE